MSPRPLRWLVVHLPAFRLERCGFDAGEVAALVDEVQNATRLVAVTPAAREVGLRVGMTAAEARSLIPEVALQALDAVGERADRAALARSFGALSDRVGFPPESPEDLVVEVSCTAHLFGGEAGAVARARELAESLGHRVTVVLADDPLGAAALAAWGEDGVIPTGSLAEHLADLPLAALRAPGELISGLRAVGIERVGQLVQLDAASIAGRFGGHGARLHQLARGLPTTAREVTFGDGGGELPRVTLPMAGATSTLQLQFALPGLLAALVDLLAARDLAAVRLALVLRLDGRRLAPVRLPVGVGRPTRNVHTLARVVRARLEGLRVDAPVEELTLEVLEASPEQGWQPGLTDRTEATEPLPELLARLQDHLGEDALVTPRLADAWRPEVAWRAIPVRHAMPREPSLPLVPATGEPPGLGSVDPVEVQRAWEQELGAPRPALLLPEPLPIEVEALDGEPVRVKLAAGARPVVRAEGPERLEGEWWAPASRFDRAYWAVELGRPSAVAWIFEDRRGGGGGRWFLHGWFD